MNANSNDLDKIITAIHKEQKELNQKGVVVEKIPPIGIMVEVPNVALNPNDFISKADFFSFRTNDLAQFLMAAERTNKNVSHYIESGNQSVLKNNLEFCFRGNSQEKKISICGELNSNINYLNEFINIGKSSLSMPPISIPKIK